MNSSRGEEEDNLEEEEWSDEFSDGSYYSDSDSSVPEWESSVHDTTGELTYIDCHPFVVQNNVENKEKSQTFCKDPLRRSTRGKFLKLLRRRDSQRQSRRHQKTQDALDSTTNKVKFRDSQEGEEKEVLLRINTGSLRCDAEGLLGINVSTLSDGNRIMVAGFPSDSDAKHEKTIKIGDWLKSVNNIPVTYQNINSILEKLKDKNELLLKLQRVAGVEVTKDPPINELNCQSQFVREFVSVNKDTEGLLNEKLTQHSIGIAYLNTDNLSESNNEYEDVIYAYPRPYQRSFLCQSRGIFITLNHLLKDVTKSQVQATSVLSKNSLHHITYTSLQNKLLLLVLPDSYVNVKAALLIHNEVIRMLIFLYKSLDLCFTIEKNTGELDHFFGRFFTKVLNRGIWLTIDSFISTTIQSTIHSEQFEDVLLAATILTLPSEAYVQIDDALTELEASDYREWNEEPLDCQRLFTILGSALYHCEYLLASHLMYDDLVDVHIYLRQQGLLHLAKTEPVKTLLLWREVFPNSCQNDLIKIPFGKRYILLAGSGKNLLAVIMEAGGCTEPAEDNMGPDAFYVEEVQATLAHIQELGIPELADRWIGSNPGAQITIPESCNKRKVDSLSNLKQHKEATKPEVTSILKRRNSDHAMITQSAFSLAESEHSEDSTSHSEFSDDNRRANDEDSEPDDYADGSQISTSSFDISELRQSILSDTELTQPQQLTSGKENVLFHFVQFDSTEGVIVRPPECCIQSHTMEVVLHNFRQASLKIHSIFENTMRFKNMPAQDMAKSVMNKSLIAIKEHGIMFECSFLDEGVGKKNKFKYWVIGRLFYMPHPKEVYVCYQDNIPQNIIELAFKIDLSTMN